MRRYFFQSIYHFDFDHRDNICIQFLCQIRCATLQSILSSIVYMHGENKKCNVVVTILKMMLNNIAPEFAMLRIFGLIQHAEFAWCLQCQVFGLEFACYLPKTKLAGELCIFPLKKKNKKFTARTKNDLTYGPLKHKRDATKQLLWTRPLLVSLFCT